MRSHNEACLMMGKRSGAAMGTAPARQPGFRRVEVQPDRVVRAMLADLVPFEELDSVMGGIAGSADSLTTIACRVFDVDPESEEAAEFAFSAFIATGQELTYALLMAATDRPAPATTDRPACTVCLTRFENEPGSGLCAQCYKPVHGGRRA